MASWFTATNWGLGVATAELMGNVASRKVRVGPFVRLWPWLLAGGWAVQVAFRVVLAWGQQVPILVPDEIGYLLAGRVFAGGASSNLSGRPLYDGGYPLLITPAFWISDDPPTVYRIVLIINALIGAALLPLAYLALRQVAALPRPAAYVIATLTALLPAGIYYGQFAVTDAILPVLVCGWLLLTYFWLRDGRLGCGIGAAALAAYSYCVHERGTIILLVFGFLLLLAWWRNWAKLRDLGVMVPVLVIGVTLSHQLNAWVQGKLYPGGVMGLGNLLTKRLTSVSGLAWTVSLVAGKIWYLIVSTWGVAGVGLVVLTVVTLRSGLPFATRVVCGLTLVSLAGIAFAASAAVPSEGATANFVYGRYLSCLLPVLFMAGATAAVRARKAVVAWSVLVSGGMALLSAAIVQLYAGDKLTHDLFLSTDFPEICFLTWTWNAFKLWPTTASALVLLAMAVIAMAVFGRRRALLPVAVGVAVVDVVAAIAFTGHVSQYWRDAYSRVDGLTADIRPADRIGADLTDLGWQIWVLHAFESRHGLTPIDPWGHFSLPPNLTAVVVPWTPGTPPRKTFPAAPRNWHVTAVSGGGWALWRRSP